MRSMPGVDGTNKADPGTRTRMTRVGCVSQLVRDLRGVADVRAVAEQHAPARVHGLDDLIEDGLLSPPLLPPPDPLPHLHQDLPQHVLPGPVAAVGPVGVVVGVLDELGVAGVEEGTTEILVLGELGEDDLAHDVVLHGFPFGAKGALALEAHAGGLAGDGGVSDGLLLLGARELLGLEVVLAGGPGWGATRGRRGSA